MCGVCTSEQLVHLQFLDFELDLLGLLLLLVEFAAELLLLTFGFLEFEVLAF